MPRPEWSFFLPAEDHKQVKWLMVYTRSRLTPFGQIMACVFIVGLAISSVGVQISAYFLPSFILALLITSVFLSLFFRPKVEARRVLPAPPSAGGSYVYKVVVRNTGRKPIRNLALFEACLPFGIYPQAEHPAFDNTADWLDPDEETTLTLALRAPRRGSFDLPPLIAGSSFPSGFLRSRRRAGVRDRLIVYPRFARQTNFRLPVHRQYQPGGIALSTKVGDSSEFISTREYREGDRLRDVHWASSARAGKLIVREYVEEYFVRVGLFMDTELKRFEKHRCFEGRISLCAGVADQLNAKDYIIDLFSSDRHLPHIRIGRGVEQFEHLLELLSVIEGDNRVDLSDAGARIEEYADQLSMLVVFLKDWDAPRRDFVRRLQDLKLHVRVLVVRDKPTTLPVEGDEAAVHHPDNLEGIE